MKKAIEEAYKIVAQHISATKISFNSIADAVKSFREIYNIILLIVFSVETIYSEYKLCTEEERIDIACEILDDIIVFKGWLSVLEPIDRWAFKMLLSAGVQALNDKYGKGSWPNVIPLNEFLASIGLKK